MKRALWGVIVVAATMASGCQTWVPEAGLTLPSPHYLEHSPQYIPPSPAFPLSRELDSLIEATERTAPGGGPVGGF